MAKLTLDWLDDDLIDFLLIGIASHSKDYKLCYDINKHMNFDFCRTSTDYTLTLKGKNATFPMFEFIDEENVLEFYLLANKSKSNYLLKELKNIDYLFMIKGNIDFIDIHTYVTQIKELSSVLTAFPVEVEQLKSKEYLIF